MHRADELGYARSVRVSNYGVPDVECRLELADDHMAALDRHDRTRSTDQALELPWWTAVVDLSVRSTLTRR
jgi:hypothetical protein